MAMHYYVGLDVSDKTTAICVLDEDGDAVLETSADTDPKKIAAVLRPYRRALVKIGLETGPKSNWLHKALVRLKLPTDRLDAFHVHGALKAQRNKTDKNDAYGIAQVLRAGWYRPVHSRSDEAERAGLLLTYRRVLTRRMIDIENAVRQTLKIFGIQLAIGAQARIPRAVLEKAVGKDPVLKRLTAAMMRARDALLAEIDMMSASAKAAAAEDAACVRLMGIPYIGPLTALTYRVVIDDPSRFRRSRTVGVYLGLTPKRFQSGEQDRSGGISRRGDRELRALLYLAAQGVLTGKKDFPGLRTWGQRLRRKRGFKVACVAVARKLAVLMHRLWRDGATYCERPAREAAAS